MNADETLRAIQDDPRYQRNLDWGEPRPGHPEGTVRAHIAELERNLDRLRPRLTDEECGKLRLLIHTHDTFKGEAARGVAITHPQSHASLARAFLAEFVSDRDLLAMVQYHDEPYALWRQARHREGGVNEVRLRALREAIEDWTLFLAFNIVDGCTEGKDGQSLRWLFRTVSGSVPSRITEADIL